MFLSFRLLKAISGRLRADVRQQWTTSSPADDASGILESHRRRRPSIGSAYAGSVAGSVINYQPCEVPEKPCTILQGRIQYNGRTIPEGGKEFFIENAMVYIDQLDQHAPRLTVDETFEFAFQCKTGGDTFRDKIAINAAMFEAMQRAKEDRLRVSVVLQALGLTHVRDTFVGDQTVRGVSGGQRRRVTVGTSVLIDYGVVDLFLCRFTAYYYCPQEKWLWIDHLCCVAMRFRRDWMPRQPMICLKLCYT